MTHTVMISDPVDYVAILEWAKRNCTSFIDSDEVDVSDVSYTYDTVCSFRFESEGDAVWFRLRWS